MNRLQKMKQELEKKLEKQLELLENIEILEENERGNTVRIGDKVFSWLRPEPNDKDVFVGPKGSKYEHVRYIRGDAMEKYLGDKQMFSGREDFEEFIEENIPGKNRKIKLQNYGDLMGLELSGYRTPGGNFHYADFGGYAWVSRSNGDEAYELRVQAIVADTGWSLRVYAQPVIVFTHSKNMNTETYIKKFQETLDKMLEITKKKNSDYSHGEYPFRNFEVVETMNIKTEHGFITRMMDKIMRVSNLVEKGDAEVKDEKIEDTLIDLANYSILFKLWLESKGGKI